MAGTVKFNMAALAPLIAHAAAAATTRPTMSQLLEPELQLPSAKGKDLFALTQEDVDLTKVPKALWLVKDRGCYLMSAGCPALLLEPDNPSNTTNVVVYGDGFGPDVDWDTQQRVCGGDDFAEALPVEMFQQALDAGATTIDVKFTRDALDISYVPGRSAA